MSGAHTFDILASAVAQEGTGTCFALLGDANMNFATRLSEAGTRMVYVRHEHCAVAAAMAYARKSGEVGLATVTCGPGLTQLMTALPAAVRASIPMVVIAGEAPLKSAWYNQQIDQAPFITATGASYHQLHWPARTPEAIRDAFLEARMTRKPVVLGIPFDLQNLAWDGGDVLPTPSADILPKVGGNPPNADDLSRAIAQVEGAKRVVVMAGMGATGEGAADSCRTLAAKLDGLLATTLPARGLFAGDPYSLGIAGGFSTDVAWEEFAKADLVIAVGCSLALHNAAHGKLWPNAKVLQVDTAPVAISQGRRAADTHLKADARLGVEALIEGVAQRPTEWRTADLAHRIATEPADATPFEITDGTLDPRDVVAKLEEVLPQDWQMVNSSGHCSYYFAQMPSRPYDKFLTIREFGAIGNGVSFAMGVAAARPDETVVLFDGDGSLLMHVQELETIARHKMNMLIVVLNDRAYGSEIHKLRADGLSDAGAVFGETDLAAVARGFGFEAETVRDLDRLPSFVDRFAKSGGVALLDIHISDQVFSPVIRRAHPELMKGR